MKIQQLSTTSCETIFKVDEEKIRLYVIVRGIPALAFEDHSFSHRYPITDLRWMGSFTSPPYPRSFSCTKGRFPHQGMNTPDDELQGPTFEILPKGEATVTQFLEHYVPLRNLRRDRCKALPTQGEIVSQRFHNKEERYYYRFSVDVNGRYVSHARTISSWGSAMNTAFEPAQQVWKEYNAVVSQIESETGDHYPSYETLTDSQFEFFAKALTRLHLDGWHNYTKSNNSDSDSDKEL